VAFELLGLARRGHRCLAVTAALELVHAFPRLPQVQRVVQLRRDGGVVWAVQRRGGPVGATVDVAVTSAPASAMQVS
jgi:hypothetical protein